MRSIVRHCRHASAAVLLCSLLFAPVALAAAERGESPLRKFLRRLIVRVFDDALSIPPGILIV